MTKFLIIADAPNPIDDILSEILEFQGYQRLFLDGITNHLHQHLTPADLVIGDLDTITPETTSALTIKAIKLIHIAEQDSTDLDKAIEHILRRQDMTKEIVIINALGGRFDHSCYNYRILKKYAHLGTHISLSNFSERIYYIEDLSLNITGPIGCAVGIISAPKASVTSSGLLYDMQNHVLEIGKAESTSNSLQNNNAALNITGAAFLSIGKSATLSLF